MRFEFDFDPAYRLAGLAFGITPRTAWVDLEEDLVVRYGPWRLRTSRDNVADVEITEDFTFLKTAGPPHLSFADRGISFTTNGRRAACVRFHEPVPAIDPTGLLADRLRHPGATLSVRDPERLREALSS